MSQQNKSNTLQAEAVGKHQNANFWTENASIDWNEADAPFHTIARITLAPQSHLGPDAADQVYFDVTRHSTPDSTPLGSINRARWPSEVASRKAREKLASSCETTPPVSVYADVGRP